MKVNKYLALLALAGSTTIHAQTNVSIYGIIDTGIEHLSNAGGTATSGDSVLRLSSGNLAGSRWGMKGSEDLGSGLSAIFVLESGIDSDTGGLGQAGRLFGRHAYVGLKTNRGAITFGHQQNIIYDQIIKYDPMSFSARYSAGSHDAIFTGRPDNAIKYIGNFGGFTASALYSFGRNLDGEVAGHPKVSRNIGAGLAYAAGPLDVGIAFDQYQGNTIAIENQRARRWTVGGSYNFEAIKAFAGFRALSDDIVTAGAPELRSHLYWAGVMYPATPALSLTAAIYHTDRKGSDADPTSAVLSGSYAFSKRTDIYATLGYAKNKGGSNLGLNGFASSIVAGENQTGLVTGIRHRF